MIQLKQGITINFRRDLELQWSSAGTMGYTACCTVFGDWHGDLSTSGSEIINNLTKSGVYNITCGVGGSSDSASLNVNVILKPFWKEIIPW